MRSRTGFALLALVGALVFGAPGVAQGAYAYNYALDWTVAPWEATPWQQNMYQTAVTAARLQANKGYTSRSYSSATAQAVYNNMGAVAVMHLRSHGGPGHMALIEGTGDDCVQTYLTSNINYTGLVRGVDGTEHDQLIEDTRYVASLNNTPVKIVIYQGCSTGADPASGLNLLYASTGYADMNFAGGFTAATRMESENAPSRQPGVDWAWKYWTVLTTTTYGANYAMHLAETYVGSVCGGDKCGYDSHISRGYPDERL